MRVFVDFKALDTFNVRVIVFAVSLRVDSSSDLPEAKAAVLLRNQRSDMTSQIVF